MDSTEDYIDEKHWRLASFTNKDTLIALANEHHVIF